MGEATVLGIGRKLKGWPRRGSLPVRFSPAVEEKKLLLFIPFLLHTRGIFEFFFFLNYYYKLERLIERLQMLKLYLKACIAIQQAIMPHKMHKASVIRNGTQFVGKKVLE